MSHAHGRRLAAVPLFRGVAVLAAATLGAGLAAPPAAWGVSVRQSYTLPSSGHFVVRGHGYGHGHGMSQYGAEGAARRGLGWRAILRFYYPGTEVATSHASIAVRIDEDTTADVQVRKQPGLSVKDRGTGKVYRLPDIARANRWRLNVNHGHTVVSYRTRHWHRWRPGGHSHLVGDGELRSRDHVLSLVTPRGTMRVRGVLRAASPSAGTRDRDTVNVLGIDDYVQGVVPAEMPASWRQAALRAQAVAARSYALRERADHLHRYYQICDTSACQVYRGLDGEDPRSNGAVRATAGRYLSYRGHPAFTQFASSSGGWTSAGGFPYLPHRADPYDGWSGNPVHSWKVRVDEARLEHRYRSLGDLKRIVVTSREGGGQWHGRVRSMELVGGKGTVRISGDTFRSVYGLRSTWFRIN